MSQNFKPCGSRFWNLLMAEDFWRKSLSRMAFKVTVASLAALPASPSSTSGRREGGTARPWPGQHRLGSMVLHPARIKGLGDAGPATTGQPRMFRCPATPTPHPKCS